MAVKMFDYRKWMGLFAGDFFFLQCRLVGEQRKASGNSVNAIMFFAPRRTLNAVSWRLVRQIDGALIERKFWEIKTVEPRNTSGGSRYLIINWKIILSRLCPSFPPCVPFAIPFLFGDCLSCPRNRNSWSWRHEDVLATSAWDCIIGRIAESMHWE